MMGKRIITISREFGSGGRFIGMEVAQKLGVKYYDKEMIGQIAEQSGFSPKYIQENAELSPKKGLFAYAFSGRDQMGRSVEDMIYEAQRKIILDIAEREECGHRRYLCWALAVSGFTCRALSGMGIIRNHWLRRLLQFLCRRRR